MQTPHRTSDSTAPIASTPAQSSVQIKQERDEGSGSRARLSIAVPNRIAYQERETENGVVIDLDTPVEETFIKPDPDANTQPSKEADYTIMVEQAPGHDVTDNSSSTASGTSIAAENGEAGGFVVDDAADAEIRAKMIAVVKRNIKAREGSVSTADGIATPCTPEASIQEPAFQRAEEIQAYGADSVEIDKPSAPKQFFSPMEVDIVASIEADRASSVAETIRQRKDSILSDTSMDLNAELQRSRSDNPTVTSTSCVSPTPIADTAQGIFNSADADSMVVPSGLRTREATEGVIVPTIDIDMTTGHDIVKHNDEEDDSSPSRQLLGNFGSDEGFEIVYSPIKGAENTIIGTPLPTAKVVNKPTEGFEAALVSDTAQSRNDLIKTAQDTTISAASVEVIERPVLSFEEFKARGAALKANKVAERATTPSPAITAEVEVPHTPTQGPENVALPTSEVHTGNDDFIDIETITNVPETPVKNHSPQGLIKNAGINTPTHVNVTPSTVEKLKAIEDLSLNTPRRSIFEKKGTPSSKFGEDKVGSPVTGNAGSASKKHTPIKREREDQENDVKEIETPSKKSKYLSLEKSREQAISLDSDDE